MKLRSTRELIVFFAVQQITLMLFRNQRACSCYGVDAWLKGLAAHCVILYRAVSCSLSEYMEDSQLREYWKAGGRPTWIIHQESSYEEAYGFNPEF